MSQNKVVYLDEAKPWDEQDLGGRRPGKSVCIVRYGGYGDMLQIAPIIKAYKDQGYYVCLNASTAHGLNVINEDPNIDELFIQKTDQVPREVLLKYWLTLKKLFTKFINLSGVVEQTLLPPQGTPPFYWPHKIRHKFLNHNYLETLYGVSDLPYDRKNVIHFYPTPEERKQAKERREAFGKDKKIIVWALAGTSKHKVYPHLDEVVAKLMLSKHKNAEFVFVGDGSCKILEWGWEKEKRVHLRSGEWTIRETMAFLEFADIVMGPETGVLNAVATADVPKVVMLSHSSKTNLTRDWTRTVSLTVPSCECYPCHRLHHTDTYCNIDDETGAAKCCLIPSDVVYNAVTNFI